MKFLMINHMEFGFLKQAMCRKYTCMLVGLSTDNTETNLTKIKKVKRTITVLRVTIMINTDI